MRIRVHNIDRMDPAALLKEEGDMHYFADTRMALRCLRFNPGFFRVHLLKVDHAFEPSYTVAKYIIDFAETPAEKTDEAFEKLLGRFPRVVDLNNSLAGQNWIHNAVDETYDAYRTPDGILLIKRVRRGDTVWSPFARLAPLDGRPATWTKDLLIRAAHNGQYAKVSAASLVSLNGPIGDDGLLEGVGGPELARILTEDEFYTWTVRTEGETVIAEGVISPSRVHRFELVPDYL
ncbi:MAG: hypothetical protein PHE83_16560 [Opitutaceae bacterium]|nr:hypothetical protein [Opitutaceae bacterium]